MNIRIEGECGSGSGVIVYRLRQQEITSWNFPLLTEDKNNVDAEEKWRIDKHLPPILTSPSPLLTATVLFHLPLLALLTPQNLLLHEFPVRICELCWWQIQWWRWSYKSTNLISVADVVCLDTIRRKDVFGLVWDVIADLAFNSLVGIFNWCILFLLGFVEIMYVFKYCNGYAPHGHWIMWQRHVNR